MNVGKNLQEFFADEPPGEKTNAVRWLQKKIMQKSLDLPHDFNSRDQWEKFRTKIREELPGLIGVPEFPSLKESFIRARIRVGVDVICERVDIYVDEDYSIPAFLLLPDKAFKRPIPGLVYSGGFTDTKWRPTHQQLALRLSRQGFAVCLFDHAPFGETSPHNYHDNSQWMRGMTLIMGMGNLLGISQLALRAAETMRVGEYLRCREDIASSRVAVAGICQGGQDTWLAAALDDGFCAAAPLLSESTFAIHAAEMASYMSNSDASPFPFGILDLCDIEHLHAAIAPRPLLVRANLGDSWWPVSGFDHVEAFTRNIYRLYEAEDKVDFRAEVHEHDVTGPFADALEAFLLKYVLE